ncbi:MAG: formate dehydrogenase subunit delta [Rhodoblastus sp.]
MSAQSEKLGAMAGQIADFFRSYPQDEAVRAIAEHINKFWTRKMRTEFVDLPDIRSGAADPLLVAAARAVRIG